MLPLAVVDERFGIALIVGVGEQERDEVGQAVDRIDDMVHVETTRGVAEDQLPVRNDIAGTLEKNATQMPAISWRLTTM